MLILHWFSEAWQNFVHFIMFPMYNNIELSIASCRLEILPSGLQRMPGLMLWVQVRLDIQNYHIAPQRGSRLAGMVILIFNINADSESLFYTPLKLCDLRQIHLLPCPSAYHCIFCLHCCTSLFKQSILWTTAHIFSDSWEKSPKYCGLRGKKPMNYICFPQLACLSKTISTELEIALP